MEETRSDEVLVTAYLAGASGAAGAGEGASRGRGPVGDILHNSLYSTWL